jgi:general secretion pathway protein G
MRPTSTLRIRSSRGFTLIEILLVVLILGLIAAIVVAGFINIQDDAEASATRSQLQMLREQIQLYRFNESAYPADLTSLVSTGQIGEVPEHPGDGDWNYDASTGVLLSTADASW